MRRDIGAPGKGCGSIRSAKRPARSRLSGVVIVQPVPPATRALIDWFELSTKQRSFIEGAAAINLAAEGQVPGAFGPMARRLQENYGLSKEAVEFWDIHEMADAEHSDVGDNIVVRHATDAATQTRVRDALQHSLDAWWQFFDGIQAAI